MKSLIREPLVHFLLFGAILFALDAALRRDGSADAGGAIVVGEARVNNLARNFARTWQRPPAPPELEGLIQDFIREEVFYREALALGLDRDDTIIRRRLRQKLEFVSSETATVAQPTDEDLSAFLAAHPEAFRIEARASFRQVFLDARRRAETLEADVKRLLAELERAGESDDTARLGDSRLLEPRYESLSESDVAKTFSTDFAEALFKLPAGRWDGPIASGYGVHLVRVESVIPGRMPALEEVRPQVERDWTNARRKELQDAFYERLRAKYRITINMPASIAAGGESEPERKQRAVTP